MTKDKELKALFVLCQDLKLQVKLLNDKVTVLSAAGNVNNSHSNDCPNYVKMGMVLHEDMKTLESFHMEELARIGEHFDKELAFTDHTVQDLCDKTEDLDHKLAMHVDKVLAIEVQFQKRDVNRAQTFSVVRQEPPQFARSSQARRSRPDQVRRPRVRVCYNCKRPGHLAASCHKPNPRTQKIGAPPPKLKLGEQLKRKQPIAAPESHSVHVQSSPEPEPDPVPVQVSEGPFVYPNGSSNPMLKDYSWKELNTGFRPYGT